MLPLTFANSADYDDISPEDRIALPVTQLSVGAPLQMKVTKPSGEVKQVTLNHTMNAAQIEWFKAGSALNLMGQT
jgi:aconitate hydratase